MWCSFYMLLCRSVSARRGVLSYTQMSGGDSIALVPYLAIVGRHHRYYHGPAAGADKFVLGAMSA